LKRFAIALLISLSVLSALPVQAQTTVDRPTSISDNRLVLNPPNGFAYVTLPGATEADREIVRTIPLWSASPTRAQDASTYLLRDFGYTCLFAWKHGRIEGAVFTPVYQLWDNFHGWTIWAKAFLGAQMNDGTPAGGFLGTLDFHPPHWGNFSAFVGLGPQLVQGRAVAGVGGVGFQYSTSR
jgi:hypothetical protein